MVDSSLVYDDVARSRLPCPMVISDIMEPTRHMATNAMMTSKRAFRAMTKASGCIEVGDEPLQPRKPVKMDRKKRRDDIKKSIYNLKNGRRN